MLAWLLHLHGVWIGEAEVTSDPSSNPLVGTENVHFKKYLKEVGHGVSVGFREGILKLVDTDGRWLVKTPLNLRCWEAWGSAFPGAKWILPNRPLKDILSSRERLGQLGKRMQIREQISTQENIYASDLDSMWADMNVLCNGGRDGEAEARRVFQFVDIEFKPEIYNDWVQPERWHGKI
jgi:hypothetical protein